MRPDAGAPGRDPDGGLSGLRATGLAVTHQGPAGPVSVLQEVDLALEPGEVVAVTGASGSGKSTLLHVLGGMLRPTAGELFVGDVAPWALDRDERAAWRNSNVGFVFQAHHLLADLTALENVLAPTWISGRSAAVGRQEAERHLSRLGLAGRLHHHPAEMSGGEAQRVAIARAVSLGPRLVLADEPTGNLDGETGRRVVDELLSSCRESGFMLLVATHDDELAGRCDRVLRIAGGRLAPLE